VKKVPFLTLTVFVLTAAFSVAGLVRPAFEEALARVPDRIADGEWYRWVTSLVVQDGGALGTVSNLAFLLIIGTLVERRLGRWRWLLYYLGGALVGQVTGYLAGTVGAGNSIAICGLAGALVVAYARGAAGRLDAAVATFFLLLVSADAFGSGTTSAIAYAVAAVVGGLLIARRDSVPRWVYPGVAVVAGVTLAALANLHGPAMLAGVALGAAVPMPRSHKPVISFS